MSRSQVLKPTDVPRSPVVLLLVDVINPFKFPNAGGLVREAVRAASRISKLKAKLKSRNIPAIYATDNYGTWQSEFSDILVECMGLPGPRGEIARTLAPSETDLVILKPQHSAFHSTPLQHLLDRMEAEKLIIVGFATDMCVMLSATDARMSGYSVWVPSDCTAAENPSRKAFALRHLRQSFKCSVRASTGRMESDD